MAELIPIAAGPLLRITAQQVCWPYYDGHDDSDKHTCTSAAEQGSWAILCSFRQFTHNLTWSPTARTRVYQTAHRAQKSLYKGNVYSLHPRIGTHSHERACVCVCGMGLCAMYQEQQRLSDHHIGFMTFNI